MWLSDPVRKRPAGRRRWVLLLGLGLLVSACGFRPMYGEASATAGTGGPAAQMAAIRIAPLPDRIGQRMHNFLRDRLNPAGQPGDPAYLLRVSLSETKQELGIRKDETATRANLIVRASFVLSDTASRATLLDGRSVSINSYNILTSQLATYHSELDARERALRDLADDIRTRLGIYFSDAHGSAS